MDFEFTESEAAWRQEVQAFLREHVTPALREELRRLGDEGGGPELQAFQREVGARGWYGLNWPKEYGGLGRSAIDQRILINEFDYSGVPPPDLTVTSVAPMIMRYGTEENKADFLPGMATGEITVAVGYSEPDAGTDLASLKTRAILDGDEWVINGSKIWNSYAHQATHEWLCVRTDPDAPKHKGISVIMVPIDSPGIEIRPLVTWADFRTNQTYFTDVRVPKKNLIGELNKGWTYITGALDLERGALTSSGDLRREVDDLLEVCRTTLLNGERLADRPAVRHMLAELDAEVEVARLFGWEAVSLIENGVIPTITVTEEKIYTAELRQKIADFGTQIFGMYGQLAWQDDRAPNHGSMERLYRKSPLMRFAGGTNEVLRDAIARRGYGMPHSGRIASAS